MKTICLYFEIHQIIHLKRYRFFDIGTDHYYYDDYENERSISDIAERSYMPALNTLHEMIKENGKYFKVAFSLSGVGIEQLEMHAPQVLQKLQDMNETGCVEFLAEPYSHGLSSLINEECFKADVKKQINTGFSPCPENRDTANRDTEKPNGHNKHQKHERIENIMPDRLGRPKPIDEDDNCCNDGKSNQNGFCPFFVYLLGNPHSSSK